MRYFLVLLMLFTCAKHRSRDAGSDSGPVIFEGIDKGFVLASELPELEFFPIENSAQNPIYTIPGQPLIGGVEQKPEDYPANFYTRQGNSRCSGTLIGEKILISAAHCMSNGGTAKLTYRGVEYIGTCTHNPNYKNNITADFSLCALNAAPPEMVYENILTDQTKLKVGGIITLAGFGGVTPGSGSGGNDGKYRAATSVITSLPSGNDHDVVTKKNDGNPGALAYGDSGGSAYYYEGTKRWDLSVNSRGDIRTTSYLSSFTSSFQAWAKSWADTKSLKICGIHADALGCRDSVIEPPSQCKVAYDALGKCIFEKLATTQSEICRSHYATLFACLETAERVD